MSKALQIKKFPGYYITDTGDVYSRIVGKYHNIEGRIKKLKPGLCKHTGYLKVVLSKTTCSVHKLVAEAFIPNPDNKKCVNHIDGNKLNNNVSNLDWCSFSENSLHSCNILGKRKPSFPILQIQGGKIIKEFSSIAEAEKQTGINHNRIRRCCESISYKTIGGVQFKYKN